MLAEVLSGFSHHRLPHRQMEKGWPLKAVALLKMKGAKQRRSHGQGSYARPLKQAATRRPPRRGCVWSRSCVPGFFAVSRGERQGALFAAAAVGVGRGEVVQCESSKE